MKITERSADVVTMQFAELSVGDVFKLFSTDGYVYIKTNDGDSNSICLEDGDACFTSDDTLCVLLDAELIVSEVTE